MTVSAKGEVEIYDTAEEAARAGAELMIRMAKEKESGETKLSVALCGGGPPRMVYKHFRQQTGQNLKAIQSVRYFWGDDRSVPNDHEDSNVKLAMDGFIRELAIPENQIYAPNSGTDNLAAEAERLTQVLQRTLPKAPGSEIPQFDLIYLGMGGDGHTASLFPGTKALEAKTPGYVSNDVPQMDTKRLTLTYPVINAARVAAIIITGEGKADLVGEIFSRGDGKKKYPIEHIQAERTIWIFSKDAASKIK